MTLTDILFEMRSFLVKHEVHDGNMLDATEVHAALQKFADEIEAWWKDSEYLRVPVDCWNLMAKKVETYDALRAAVANLLGVSAHAIPETKNQKGE